MLRLVSKYRKELLNDTYKHIAEQFEMKGNLKKARSLRAARARVSVCLFLQDRVEQHLSRR